MSYQDWQDEARRRFGDNPAFWYFQCPICKGIQCPEDFRQYKDRGATPDSARYNCLGRYQQETAGKNLSGTPESRCDYTLGGLFRLTGVIVIHNGEERHCFDFAPDVEEAEAPR
ncbi:MAG: VVA0879 family protein [Pyrinomonadaceae bacterium]